MKKYFIILSLICFLHSNESYFSIYGFGEKSNNLNTSNISLGWSELFNGNNKFNTGSLSNFYDSPFMRFSISSDINYYIIDKNSFYTQKINYFSLLMSIGKLSGLGFTLSPLYKIFSNIQEGEYGYIGADQTPDGSILAYRSEYELSGGPSVFSILYSKKVSDNLSLGIELKYVFGNVHMNMHHFIYDLEYSVLTFMMDQHYVCEVLN